jgi:hypothetical protein
MKPSKSIILSLSAVSSFALSSFGADISNDTFLDGTRTDPATYSEQGVDSDLDGNIETRWFGGGLTSSVGHLNGAVGTGSASWTTYFTDTFANSVTLANPGDMLKVTWVFTPTAVTNQNASQGFRMALVQTPNGARLSTDATPPSTNYTGYGIFENFAPLLGRGNNDNLDIMERNVASGDILGTGGNWIKLGGGGTLNNEGFLAGLSYTFVMTAQRTALGELQLNASFSGGNIDGSGSLSASFLDTTPNSFSFDTFSLRPSSASSSAGNFDTTQLHVEFIQAPEPATAALLGAGIAGFFIFRRRR